MCNQISIENRGNLQVSVSNTKILVLWKPSSVQLLWKTRVKEIVTLAGATTTFSSLHELPIECNIILQSQRILGRPQHQVLENAVWRVKVLSLHLHYQDLGLFKSVKTQWIPKQFYLRTSTCLHLYLPYASYTQITLASSISVAFSLHRLFFLFTQLKANESPLESGSDQGFFPSGSFSHLVSHLAVLEASDCRKHFVLVWEACDWDSALYRKRLIDQSWNGEAHELKMFVHNWVIALTIDLEGKSCRRLPPGHTDTEFGTTVTLYRPQHHITSNYNFRQLSTLLTCRKSHHFYIVYFV